MYPLILALSIGNTLVSSMPFIVAIIAIIMVFGCSIYKKRLEHQQIMAAIEKNIPLSELKLISELQPQKQQGANWIMNMSAGIGLIIMGLGSITVVLTATRCTLNQHVPIGIVFFGLILLTVGITRLIRGILQRKESKISVPDTNQGV